MQLYALLYQFVLIVLLLFACGCYSGGNQFQPTDYTRVLIKYDIFSRLYIFSFPPTPDDIRQIAPRLFPEVVFEPVQVMIWIPELFDYAELGPGEKIRNNSKVLLQDVREYELSENYPNLQFSGRDETALRMFLLQGYDQQVWPWIGETDTCQVRLFIHFHKILGVDMPTGLLSAAVWFKLQWTDPRLQWDPEDWNNIKNIYFGDEEFGRGELWTPQIELWNGEEPSWFHLAPQQFRVNSSGTVSWNRNGKFLVACNLKGLGGFPYDRMTCLLEFGSWNYAISEVDLYAFKSGYSTGNTSITAGTNSPYQEYDIIRIDVKRHVYDENFPVLLYRLHLSRQHVHYTAKIIVPQAILTLVGFGAFWLHPASGERMGLAITVPVANAVYDLIMYEQLPTSRELVFVALFGMGSFVFSMLTVLETILVMHLGYKSDATLFSPLRHFRTLKTEAAELADWTRLIQYMEKRVNPGLQRTGSMKQRFQSFGNIRQRKNRPSRSSRENTLQQMGLSNFSRNLNANSQQTGRDIELAMGARVLRPQDSCIVHQSSTPLREHFLSSDPQQKNSEKINNIHKEEEEYESASEMDQEQNTSSSKLEQFSELSNSKLESDNFEDNNFEGESISHRRGSTDLRRSRTLQYSSTLNDSANSKHILAQLNNNNNNNHNLGSNSFGQNQTFEDSANLTSMRNNNNNSEQLRDETNFRQQNSGGDNQGSTEMDETVFHRTTEEAKRFVDRLLKMEIPSKGSTALQRAARRALRRHGHAKLEHRLLGILGHEDIVAALRRIDPRSYKDAVASEYNLRWQAVAKMIDFISQWLFVTCYFLFCGISYTVVLIHSRRPPDKDEFF